MSVKIDGLKFKNLQILIKKGTHFPFFVLKIGEDRYEIKTPDLPKPKRRETNYKIDNTILLTHFDPASDPLIIEAYDFDELKNPRNIGKTEMSVSGLKVGKKKSYKLKLTTTNDSEVSFNLTLTSNVNSRKDPHGSPNEQSKSNDNTVNLSSSDNNQSALRHYKPSEIKRDMPHIAKGSFGIVYTGHVPGIKEKIVIKDMDIVSQNSVEEWKKEIDLMKRVSSPYTVPILGYSYNENSLMIIMEYLPKGSLFDVLHKRHEKISIIQRMRMARHCALGLRFLHQNGIIHRDVKSMNILVSEDYSCKLTDFGCAKVLNTGNQNTHHLNTANSGTPLWMAPEVRKGLHYDYSADIYSLGLVIYELFENQLPVYNQMTHTTELPKQFKSMYIVHKCIKPNPKERLTAAEVLNDLNVLITNILERARDLLPLDDDKAIKKLISKGNGKDAIDDELTVLYSYLLTKDPDAVDDLINKAFGGEKSRLKKSLPNSTKG